MIGRGDVRRITTSICRGQIEVGVRASPASKQQCEDKIETEHPNVLSEKGLVSAFSGAGADTIFLHSASHPPIRKRWHSPFQIERMLDDA